MSGDVDRPRAPGRVLVATGSAHKLREIRSLLSGVPGFDVELVGLSDLGTAIPEPDEPFATFHQNAARKAGWYAARSGMPVLADDSGLCVDALGGAPGVHSKRFSGRDDLARDELDEANNEFLLDRLRGVPEEERTAHYVCAAAYAKPGARDPLIVVACRSGRILDAPRGEGGFGYDPLFLVPERGATYGELAPEEKERTSHRARAFRAMTVALHYL